MIPGQLRPTFARNDRAKRISITIAAVILAVGAFAGTSSIARWLPFIAALIVMLVVLQIIYHRRMRDVRRVAARIAEHHPASRVLVGNVRFVGPSDGGPEAVPFVTTILEFSATALQLWNPDAPERPIAAIPLEGIDVDVMKTRPPRLGLIAPYDNSATYLALFGDKGLGFSRADDLHSLATELLPSDEPAPSN